MRDRDGYKIQCPACRKTDVHYAQARGLRSFLMGMLFNSDALRCHSCRKLFYKSTAPEDETEPAPDAGARNRESK